MSQRNHALVYQPQLHRTLGDVVFSRAAICPVELWSPVPKVRKASRVLRTVLATMCISQDSVFTSSLTESRLCSLVEASFPLTQAPPNPSSPRLQRWEAQKFLCGSFGVTGGSPLLLPLISQSCVFWLWGRWHHIMADGLRLINQEDINRSSSLPSQLFLHGRSHSKIQNFMSVRLLLHFI